MQQRAVGAQHRFERRELRILADRRHDRVRLKAERAVRNPLAAGGEVDLRAFEHEPAADPLAHALEHCAVAQLHAFLERFLDFLPLGRHVGLPLEREQRHVVPYPGRAARDVDRRAAAPDHDQRPAQSGRRAGIGARKPLRAVHHPGLAVIELRHAFLAPRAHGEVDHIEFPPQTGQRLR